MEDKQTLLALARRVIACRISGDDPFHCDIPDSEALAVKTGAFVTITSCGKLRGCIGYLEPIAPLYKSVMDNADNIVLRNGGRRPLQAQEMDDLHIEISLLTQPEPIDSIEHISVGQHGILLRKGHRQAVFLPQVLVENGWSVEEALAQLAEKAGLGPTGWQKQCRISRFAATVFTGQQCRPESLLLHSAA